MDIALCRNFEDNNVDTKYVMTTQGEATGVAPIIVDQVGAVGPLSNAPDANYIYENKGQYSEKLTPIH